MGLFGIQSLSCFFIPIQALESEDVMIRFHSVYEKLNQALDGMPYAEIGISEEVKEQVCIFVFSSRILWLKILHE